MKGGKAYWSIRGRNHLAVLLCIYHTDKQSVPISLPKQPPEKKPLSRCLKNRLTNPINCGMMKMEVKVCGCTIESYLAEQVHPEIISKEMFVAVQKERQRRSNIENGVKKKASKWYCSKSTNV